MNENKPSLISPIISGILFFIFLLIYFLNITGDLSLTFLIFSFLAFLFLVYSISVKRTFKSKFLIWLLITIIILVISYLFMFVLPKEEFTLVSTGFGALSSLGIRMFFSWYFWAFTYLGRVISISVISFIVMLLADRIHKIRFSFLPILISYFISAFLGVIINFIAYGTNYKLRDILHMITTGTLIIFPFIILAGIILNIIFNKKYTYEEEQIKKKMFIWLPLVTIIGMFILLVLALFKVL